MFSCTTDYIMKKIIDNITYDTDTSKELGGFYSKFQKTSYTLFESNEKKYFLCYGNEIEPMTEDEAKWFVVSHLDAKASKRIFNTYYTVCVEAYIDDEEFFDEYEPKTQSWKDIENCYDKQCEKIELEYTNFDEDGESCMNGYQPIHIYRDNKGNRIEVYVCRCN